MSTLPLYSPKFRAFDSDGDPLSGGKLYTYTAGTTTPLSTYTTRAGTIANANPVVLNANGEADVWTTPGVLYKFVLKDASDVTQWTVDNVPGGSEATSSSDSAIAVDPGGRLTLTTATSVTTADVTAATSVYYTPHKHNQVPLYDGTTWTLSTFTELSLATSDATKSPAAVAVSSMYDVFVWNDAGTLRLSRGPAWTNDTTRGTGAGTTEITRVGGRYVNANAISNGPAAQRGLYVGTIRSDGSAQIEDSMARRRVWNAYHRAQRPMSVIEATASWTYNTETFRQANAAAANQLDFVLGNSEEPVRAEVRARCKMNSGDIDEALVGIGLDSTSANSANAYASLPLSATALAADGESSAITLGAAYQGFPGKGRHFLAWLEYASATKIGGGAATTTWYGTTSSSLRIVASGILGHVFA